MVKRTSNHGFTLIELLIVIAIIAILAAIAAPNFLEAQIRSKVSRAKADIRALVTALEIYRTDHNAYPVPSDALGVQVPMDAAVTDGFETKLSLMLTTPVAYVTTRLNEPFPLKDQDDEDQLYHYSTRRYFIELASHASPDEFDEYVEQAVHEDNDDRVKYFILSHGPDLDHDEPGGHGDDDHDVGDEDGHPPEGGESGFLYDPTNGTISNGDIIYWGPGVGFR